METVLLSQDNKRFRQNRIPNDFDDRPLQLEVSGKVRGDSNFGISNLNPKLLGILGESKFKKCQRSLTDQSQSPRDLASLPLA